MKTTESQEENTGAVDTMNAEADNVMRLLRVIYDKCLSEGLDECCDKLADAACLFSDARRILVQREFGMHVDEE